MKAADSSSLDLQALAQLCAVLVESEEAHLAATLASLLQVRTSLRGNDPSALAEALQLQDQVIQESARLRQDRQRFRNSAAKALRLPPEAVTLDKVSRLFQGEARQQLVQARDRLRNLSKEVERLLRLNGLLTHYYLDFLQRLFAQITGGQPQCDRYGPQGTLRPAACGSLIKARG